MTPATRVVLLTAVLASLLAAAAAATAAAYLDGPPPAHTGGFNEPTCHVCHADQDLNSPGGSIEIDGLPDAYSAGQTYRFTIAVKHARLERAGFELAFRFAEGPGRGQQAGTLSSTDERTHITKAPNEVQYAHHVRSSTDPFETGVGKWTLEWTAPAGSHETILLHVAANASNYNDSELGDWIYARVHELRLGK